MSKSVFVCQSCGHQSVKWIGKCPSCDEWDSFVEELIAKPSQSSPFSSSPIEYKVEKLSAIKRESEGKIKTNIDELDRALGGGIEPGSLILLGGDPGIGKSTLASEIAGKKNSFSKVLYVSGEESATQVKGRFERLELDLGKILFIPETNVEKIIEHTILINPDLIIVDSIQTIYTERITSQAGSVGNIRESTAMLISIAKSTLIPIVIIGHVTKEGAIAGPRVLEHMVDVVLYFEGEHGSPFRILRSVKNRFGSSLELGLFEMKETGLKGVDNPSGIMLRERNESTPGSTVTSHMAGFRPILVEIQALVSRSFYPSPKRASVGVDPNRLAIIIAIIEKRLDLHIGSDDIFVNAVGGVKMDEPAIDLAIAIAIISGFRNKPVPADLVIFGELGLGAEIRTAPRTETRIKEAMRLGFKQAVIPNNSPDNLKLESGFKIERVSMLSDAVDIILPS